MVTMADVVEGRERWHVQHADALHALTCLPDACVDLVATDPPYGLGTKEPDVKAMVAYLLGANLDTGGDFMGTDWEIPSVETWRQCYRVLKPGGHVFCFGSTRTWDLISIGLRAAGFELRDTIKSDHPAFAWVQGQGFPKSLDVAKAIAKAEPTADAAQYEGLGTALKPSWEPILVFRKPVEGTVARNVLKYGTGALNIEATRVAHASPDDFEKHKAMVERLKAQGGSLGESWKNSSDLAGANDVTEAGRWPANMLLTHADGCRKVGTTTAHGRGHFPSLRGPSGQFGEEGKGGLLGATETEERHLTNERIDAWECVDGCPAKALDAQSGDRPSTLTGRADPSESHAHPSTVVDRDKSMFGVGAAQANVYADSGGASRFYPQFEGQEVPDEAFYYCAKANRSEREAGLDDLPVRSGAEATRSKEGQVRLKSPRTGAGRGGGVRNDHPTVKPIDLMRWLVRLGTPPGGLVLDPYVGSGTTGIATMMEPGVFRFLGFERKPKHVRIAELRIRHVAGGRWRTVAEVIADAAATPGKKQLGLF